MSENIEHRPFQALLQMRLLNRKWKRVLWFLPLVVALCFFAAFIRHGKNLSGYVASYSILPHSSGDVFDFNNGSVTWRTCCGNESRGTYVQTTNGVWLWTYKSGKGRVYEWTAKPGWFSVTFADINHPTNTATLPRRLFAPRSL